jgi:hypothetical protein
MGTTGAGRDDALDGKRGALARFKISRALPRQRRKGEAPKTDPWTVGLQDHRRRPSYSLHGISYLCCHTGGRGYSLSGTIGQPDAGTVRGGDHPLQAGFWGRIAAIQAPGAPGLNLTQSAPNRGIISWPFPSTGWTLYESANLNPVNWPEALTPPQDNGATKSVALARRQARGFIGSRNHR